MTGDRARPTDEAEGNRAAGGAIVTAVVALAAVVGILVWASLSGPETVEIGAAERGLSESERRDRDELEEIGSGGGGVASEASDGGIGPILPGLTPSRTGDGGTERPSLGAGPLLPSTGEGTSEGDGEGEGEEPALVPPTAPIAIDALTAEERLEANWLLVDAVAVRIDLLREQRDAARARGDERRAARLARQMAALEAERRVIEARLEGAPRPEPEEGDEAPEE